MQNDAKRGKQVKVLLAGAQTTAQANGLLKSQRTTADPARAPGTSDVDRVSEAGRPANYAEESAGPLSSGLTVVQGSNGQRLRCRTRQQKSNAIQDCAAPVTCRTPSGPTGGIWGGMPKDVVHEHKPAGSAHCRPHLL